MADNTEALPPLPEQEQFEAWAQNTFGPLQRDDRLDYLYTDVRAAWRAWQARAALAQRQQVPTTAWLVEWRFNGVQWLYLWPSAPGGFSFTSDASKALRFARREDAEAALQWARDTDAARRPIGSLTRHGLALGEMLVTEHDWPALTAAPSAQAEPVATVLRGAHVTRDGFHIEWHTEPPMGESKLYAAPPAAQAEPQVPLTDDQVLAIFRKAVDGDTIKLTRDVGPYEVTEPTHAARKLVNAIVAAARGIGKQEVK